MPIEDRLGDIFAQPDVKIIAHQANLFHTMGAGIAKIIKARYPMAYEADCETPHGDYAKLGTYSKAVTPSGQVILNVYSQKGLGSKDRDTSYDALWDAFEAIEAKVRAHNEKQTQPEIVIAVPYGYGSNLAGGKWRVVRAMFGAIFDNSPVKLVIIRLPSQGDLE